MNKSNLATYAVYNNQTFPQMKNMTLIEIIQRKDQKQTYGRYLKIFKHNIINNKTTENKSMTLKV